MCNCPFCTHPQKNRKSYTYPVILRAAIENKKTKQVQQLLALQDKPNTYKCSNESGGRCLKSYNNLASLVADFLKVYDVKRGDVIIHPWCVNVNNTSTPIYDEKVNAITNAASVKIDTAEMEMFCTGNVHHVEMPPKKRAPRAETRVVLSSKRPKLTATTTKMEVDDDDVERPDDHVWFVATPNFTIDAPSVHWTSLRVSDYLMTCQKKSLPIPRLRRVLTYYPNRYGMKNGNGTLEVLFEHPNTKELINVEINTVILYGIDDYRDIVIQANEQGMKAGRMLELNIETP